MDQTALVQFFVDLVGEIPPEFEGLIYVFALFVLLFVICEFFTMLSTLLGVTKWNK